MGRAAGGWQQVMRCSPPAPIGDRCWRGGVHSFPGVMDLFLSPAITSVLVSRSSQCKSAFQLAPSPTLPALGL